MRRRAAQVWRGLLALAATAAAGGVARAEEEVPTVISPLRFEGDQNGANLVDGRTVMELPVLSVPGAPNLRFDRLQNAAPYVKGTVQTPLGAEVDQRRYSIHTGTGTSDSFQCENYLCTSVTGTGSTFRYAGRRYQQSGSGAVWQFNLLHSATASSHSPYQTMMYYASSVAYPNGEVITYSYTTATLNGDPFPGRRFYRPATITSNLGYYISLTFAGEDFNGDMAAWGRLTQAAIYSGAPPIDPNAPPATPPLGRLTYSGGTITDHGSRALTDPAGRAYTCAGCNNALGIDIEVSEGSMQLPDEGSPVRQVAPVTTVPQSATRPVGSVTRDGVQWSYAYDNLHYQNPLTTTNGYLYDHVTVTGPNSYHVVYDVAQRAILTTTTLQNVVTRVTDSLNRSTSYQFDMSYRPIQIVFPEQNRIDVSYDEFGNIISRTTTPKPNMGQPITETANYPTATCAPNNTSTALCWRPSWSRDGMLRRTDYAYNEGGQLIEQTDPADNEGIRRRTCIQYDPVQYVPGTSSRRDVVSIRGDTTPCTTTAPIRTEYDYWGNTFLPSVERRIDASQSPAVTLETRYGYDAAGRLTSTDGPLAGSDDAIYYRYDVYGRRTWEIGARGAGGLRIATRTTYRDADDKVLSAETGTLPDANSTVLTVFRRTDFAYGVPEDDDPTTIRLRRNPLREAVSASGVTLSVTDRSWDESGRSLCTAVRMNLVALPPLPNPDACLPGQAGAQGPDRITENFYDAAGQRTQLREGVGTGAAAAEATWDYNLNGQLRTVIDGNGNRAELRYDGHGRQNCWLFPSPTRPPNYTDTTPATALQTAGSVNGDCVSQGDYEAYGYDAAGNRTSLRKRDGSVLTYQYDDLNRMTAKIVPSRAGLTAAQTRDVYYGYDLFDRQTRARFDSINGEGVTNAYDGFGRLVSHSINMGGTMRALAYRWDDGGRRTRITHPVDPTHPAGAFFSTTYDALGRPTWITDPAGSAVASFGYDAAGHPNGIGRPGATTGLNFRADGALLSLSHYIGAPLDVRWTFAPNPAGQIASVTRTNDAYAWTGHYAIARAYTTNGLNQYSQTVGGGATVLYSYDANGNLLTAPDPLTGQTITYTYDVENRLVAASGGIALVYDPLGRLFRMSGASGTTTFLYDGDALVAEYNGSGAMTQRYVHGPGAEVALVWYEDGDGTTVADRRYLLADHQGSIVAVADNAGTRLAVNSYDEYGIPALGNSGRFHYTGQIRLPELGMYYYKARMYSAGLGRFLQTDPIGYEGGINLYDYAGDDPVNRTDPTGLWSPLVHETIFRNVLRGRFNETQIRSVIQASYGQDRHEPGASNLAAHHLRSATEAPAHAMRAFNSYVNGEIAAARQFHLQGNNAEALRHFAFAGHAISDAYSPMHRDANGNPNIYLSNVPTGLPIPPNALTDAILQGHSPWEGQGGEDMEALARSGAQPAIQRRLLEILNQIFGPVLVTGSRIPR